MARRVMSEGVVQIAGALLGEGPRANRTGCSWRVEDGQFAQELAAATELTLAQLRTRAEPTESAVSDLRHDDARVLLCLRRQVELWRLVRGGAGRVKGARLARSAVPDDAGDRASPYYGTDPSDTGHIADYADNDTTRTEMHGTSVAGIADSGIHAVLAGRTEPIDLADTHGLAGSAELAGRTGHAGTGDHRRVGTDPAGSAAAAESAEPAGKAGMPIGGIG